MRSAAEGVGSLNPPWRAVFGSPGPWVFHGELGGSVTSAPALEGFDPIQAAQREGGSTQDAVGADLPPASPKVPALPRSQGDSSNSGRWVEGTRRALRAFPAQTLVLLRWCQNIRYQPRALLLPTLHMAGVGGGGGMGGVAQVRPLAHLSWGPAWEGPRRALRLHCTPTPHPASPLFSPLPAH